MVSPDWTNFVDDELIEILASLEDSDRYILFSRKMRMIETIKIELIKRGHLEYQMPIKK